jgi:hypothetical protein
METEEHTRTALLLENIQTQVMLIAETCGSLVKRQDDTIEWLRKLDAGQRNLEAGQRNLEAGQRNLEVGLRRLEDRHDVLLGRVDRMEIRFELKLDELEAFASDAQLRLKRIETHLQLSGPRRSGHASPQRKVASGEPSSKRGKKS